MMSGQTADIQNLGGFVWSIAKTLSDGVDEATRDMILFGPVGGNLNVYDLSRFTFDKLRGQDPRQLHNNLVDYINHAASPKKDKKI